MHIPDSSSLESWQPFLCTAMIATTIATSSAFFIPHLTASLPLPVLLLGGQLRDPSCSRPGVSSVMLTIERVSCALFAFRMCLSLRLADARSDKIATIKADIKLVSTGQCGSIRASCCLRGPCQVDDTTGQARSCTLISQGNHSRAVSSPQPSLHASWFHGCLSGHLSVIKTKLRN